MTERIAIRLSSLVDRNADDNIDNVDGNGNNEDVDGETY